MDLITEPAETSAEEGSVAKASRKPEESAAVVSRPMVSSGAGEDGIGVVLDSPTQPPAIMKRKKKRKGGDVIDDLFRGLV